MLSSSLKVPRSVRVLNRPYMPSARPSLALARAHLIGSCTHRPEPRVETFSTDRPIDVLESVSRARYSSMRQFEPSFHACRTVYIFIFQCCEIRVEQNIVIDIMLFAPIASFSVNKYCDIGGFG